MELSTVEIHPNRESATETPVRLKARIIIPVWGAKYVARLDTACLPALLAPGNLPHLAERFECELVVVTEASLFANVRALPSIRLAEKYCKLKLVAMDDVLSHPSYYGYTITHSLYRGFTDLGEAAKDVWCLFLNADFILADGAYRALVAKIQAGERCILAPSYCTIEENVRPAFDSHIAAGGGVLALPPREMASLILDNRHYTVRAKTVNWRMYKIDHVDQLYYVVDRDTLLCKQIPIAVVAFRPERVPAEPVAFWDYGVLSEICPSGPLCVLGDSDDFLMLELRARRGMADWLKLGWLDKDEIARHLSLWSTSDQRRCADFTLLLHRAGLPPTLPSAMQALDEYWRDVAKRLSPQPRDHRNHYIWNRIVPLHREWRASQIAGAGSAGQRTLGGVFADAIRSFAGLGGNDMYRWMRELFGGIYGVLFGRLPEVGFLHPQKADLEPVVALLKGLAAGSRRALCIWTRPRPAVAPHLSQWIAGVVDSEPEALLEEKSWAELGRQGPFDFCFLELSRAELIGFERLYLRLRPLMRPGGRVVMFYQTRGLERIGMRDLDVIHHGLPSADLPELEFRGSYLSMLAQSFWEREQESVEGGGTLALLKLAVVAALTAPLAAIGNWTSSIGDPGRIRPACTSLLLQVKIL